MANQRLFGDLFQECGLCEGKHQTAQCHLLNAPGPSSTHFVESYNEPQWPYQAQRSQQWGNQDLGWGNSWNANSHQWANQTQGWETSWSEGFQAPHMWQEPPPTQEPQMWNQGLQEPPILQFQQPPTLIPSELDELMEAFMRKSEKMLEEEQQRTNRMMSSMQNIEVHLENIRQARRASNQESTSSDPFWIFQGQEQNHTDPLGNEKALEEEHHSVEEKSEPLEDSAISEALSEEQELPTHAPSSEIAETHLEEAETQPSEEETSKDEAEITNPKLKIEAESEFQPLDQEDEMIFSQLSELIENTYVDMEVAQLMEAYPTQEASFEQEKMEIPASFNSEILEFQQVQEVFKSPSNQDHSPKAHNSTQAIQRSLKATWPQPRVEFSDLSPEKLKNREMHPWVIKIRVHWDPG